MILKGGMQVRLGGMPRVPGLGEKAQIRDVEGPDKPFLFHQVPLKPVGRQKGMKEKEKSKQQAAEGRE